MYLKGVGINSRPVPARVFFVATNYFTGNNSSMLGERFSKFSNRERAVESSKEVRFKSGAVLRLTENNGEFSLQIKKDGVTTNLLDLAPPGIQLVKQKESGRKGLWGWGAILDYRGTGHAAILFDKLKNIGDLLGFLHEAGHLRDAQLIRAVKAAKAAHKLAAFHSYEAYTSKRMRAMAKEWPAVRDAEYAAWEHALKDANNLDEKYGLKIF